MKPIYLLTLFCAGALLAGCTTYQPQTSTPARGPSSYVGEVPQEPIATSLFPADQAVLNDETVARIFASKLELPATAKLALMKFPNTGAARYYGRYYWQDEEYLKLQQAQVDTLSKALLASAQIAEITPLPSLMIPSRVSLPALREAAVRLQADLLLVYRVGSDTYSQYRAFAKDRVKAYSTCELVLLDVRTGLVPFAKVVSRERLEVKQAADLDLSETMRRAEQASSVEALQAAAEELVRFVKTVPAKAR